MPDLHFRLLSRRKALAKIHASPEWKAATKQFKIDHPWCAWHYKYGILIPTFVPHHPYRDTYAYPELYLDLEKSGCIPMCRSCHYAVDKGLDICPECKDGYKPIEAEMCRKCLDKKDPQRVELREIAKERRKREQKAYRHKKYLEAKQKHKERKNAAKSNKI